MDRIYLKCSDQHFYVGCTEDLDERLKRHRNYGVPATAGRLPIELIHTSSFPDKYKAFAFEKYLKSGSGRAFMKKHFIVASP
ncbi:MAG: GIY-YIG nuclease family protein [Bacteroidia bacterium]|nr:GIY-YIG nuclease family protein [Bacteroidia bacterium]